MSDSPGQRWVVDSIEESMVSIEVDGGRMMTVPRWMLPSGSRQGHVLAVHNVLSADGLKSVLTIEVDEKATNAALERSRQQVARLVKRSKDSGGDVAL